MIDRRLFLGAAASLGLGEAIAQAPPAPVAMPDVPRSEIEKTALAASNAAIIRRQNQLLNAGDIPAAVALFAENSGNHGFLVGRPGLLRVLTDIHAMFPDWHTEILDLAAMDDIVVVRDIGTGTHRGIGKVPVLGGLLVGVQPTGKRFKVQSIHWYRMEGGLIADHRASRDDIGMMQQLGLLPMSQRYDLPKVS